jgi:hypothetical protein
MYYGTNGVCSDGLLRYYYCIDFGFLLLVTAAITIVITYFRLRREEYRWWWSSLTTSSGAIGASTASCIPSCTSHICRQLAGLPLKVNKITVCLPRRSHPLIITSFALPAAVPKSTKRIWESFWLVIASKALLTRTVLKLKKMCTANK